MFEQVAGGVAWVEGRRQIVLLSNNYLGLATDARVVAAAQEAITQFGTSRCASPLVGGHTLVHRDLERKLAAFLQQDDAALFASGYQANLGVLTGLMRRGDLIVSDLSNHASIVDGARLSGAELRFFRHNRHGHLESVLRNSPSSQRKIVVVEGVYSVDGDIASLPELCSVAHRYGAPVVVDEAHALGVLGAGGRGASEHFEHLGRVDLITGTLSKSLGSVGGFVAGGERLVRAIRHSARALIYSAALAPSNAAAGAAALDVLEAEPERRTRLWALTERLVSGLRAHGFDTMSSETPVVPVLMGRPEIALEFTVRLRDEGVLVAPIVPPIVPPHLSRVRAHVTAAHDETIIDEAVRHFAVVKEAMRLVT